MILQARRRENAIDAFALARRRRVEESCKCATRSLQRKQNIVFDGMTFEDRRLLEFAADAEFGNAGFVDLGEIVLAGEIDVARIRSRLAGDHVHHRRLASAVRTDDRAHFTRLEYERKAA